MPWKAPSASTSLLLAFAELRSFTYSCRAASTLFCCPGKIEEPPQLFVASRSNYQHVCTYSTPRVQASCCIWWLGDVWIIKSFMLCHVLMPMIMTEISDIAHLRRKNRQRFGGRICLRAYMERRKGEPFVVYPFGGGTLRLITRSLRCFVFVSLRRWTVSKNSGTAIAMCHCRNRLKPNYRMLGFTLCL